jgi:DNA-binding CsgD family transcriptional regulator
MGVKALRAIDSVLDDATDSALRAAVKSRLGTFLNLGTGDYEEGEAAIREAQALFEQAGDRRGALLAANELAYVQMFASVYAGLESEGNRLAAAAEAIGEPAVAIQAMCTAAWGAGLTGHFERADQAWERAIVLCRRENHPYRLAYSLGAQADCLALAGRIGEAWPLFEAARGIACFRETMTVELESEAYWLAGDFASSVRAGREAVAWNPEGLAKRRWLHYAFSILSAIEMGLLDEARKGVSGIRAAGGTRTWIFLEEMAGHVEGFLAWREDRPAEALTAFRGSAARLLETAVHYLAAFVLVDLAEMAAETRQSDAAREAAASLDEVAGVLDRDLYRALAGIGAAWAHLAAGTPDRAAERARVGVELLSDTGYRAFLGRALHVLGCSLAAIDRGAARDALQQAAATFDACGASWRRDRARETLRHLGGAGLRAAGATQGAESLTRRERDVGRLASQGLSARQIAERLFIGERTVEGHLAAVYAKVGVESKLELVRRASELRL